MDFQFDSTWHGKTIKICNIIDEYTRKHLAFTVDEKIDADSVIELLDLASLDHGGRPRVIRMDNGPEFIIHTLKDWTDEDETIQAFIPPGKPWHNGFVESFHNQMRDELLEDNSIENPKSRSWPNGHDATITSIRIPHPATSAHDNTPKLGNKKRRPTLKPSGSNS